MKKLLNGSRIKMKKQQPMHEWYDSLTMGQKMALWVEFKAEGDPTNKVVEKAYKKYLKTFKLKVA
jgi:ABC-type glutathione transport system ATPase component